MRQDQSMHKSNVVTAAASFHAVVYAIAYLQAMKQWSQFQQGKCCDCSRIFPNEEMDQLATALRQVARMLWGIHVTLQMGFEQEASLPLYAHSCMFVRYCNPFACSSMRLFLE